jgi:hypothetical protein
MKFNKSTITLCNVVFNWTHRHDGSHERSAKLVLRSLVRLNVADFAGVQNSVSLATIQVQLRLVQKQYCYKAAEER